MVLRNSLRCLLLVILAFSGSAIAAAPAADPDWQSVAPGIEFRKYQLSDPNNIFVTRMDRSNPEVTLESSVASGKLIEGRESVSGMYQRYDQAINFWGGSSNPPSWGMRNQVVVAINGSYFDLESGVPRGGMIQSGWYAKSFDNLGGWGGFAWKMNRTAFISECLYHFPEKQFITFSATGKTMQITGVNKPRHTNELLLYTPQYNDRSLNDQSGVEVVVQMKEPTMLMPKPAYVTGVVTEIHIGEGKTPIPFNSIVLSTTDKKAQTLLENIQIGSEIRVTQEITSYEYDCTTPYSLSWTKTYSSIQGAFFFLKNGQIRDFNDPGAIRRNPRSAIAFNDQYIYFIVVDGRDYYHSVGMTIHELAVFARDTLGANWGVAQDGGGSSTMVINGQVVNNTYCNIYTCSGYYTPSVYLPKEADDYHNAESNPNSIIVTSPAGIERTVANGILMVRVLPERYSPTFATGESVATVSDIDLRLGPGTNYSAFTTIPQGAQGIIMEQLNGLDGVLAKSSYWWYVNFGGITGWVPENSLVNLGGGIGLADLFEQLRMFHFPTSGLDFNSGR